MEWWVGDKSHNAVIGTVWQGEVSRLQSEWLNSRYHQMNFEVESYEGHAKHSSYSHKESRCTMIKMTQNSRLAMAKRHVLYLILSLLPPCHIPSHRPVQLYHLIQMEAFKSPSPVLSLSTIKFKKRSVLSLKVSYASLCILTRDPSQPPFFFLTPKFSPCRVRV